MPVLKRLYRTFKTIDLLKSLSQLPSEQKNLIQDVLYEWQSLQDLEKRLVPTLKSLNMEGIEDSLKCVAGEDKLFIWRLWLQGHGNAPDIVKACSRSVQKKLTQYTTHNLDQTNIDDYIEVPGYIYDHLKTGRMKPVNFSDYLRCALLSQNGGIWLDSTVLVTASLPKDWLRTDFFAFAVTPTTLLGRSNILTSSWFISASRYSKVMSAMHSLMLAYWEKPGGKTHHYYFHLIMRIAISQIRQCRDEFHEMPFVSNVPPHVMQQELFNQWNENKWNLTLANSPIHKLTYYSGDFAPETPGTFYQYIISR
jgi:hypothetical protein